MGGVVSPYAALADAVLLGPTRKHICRSVGEAGQAGSLPCDSRHSGGRGRVCELVDRVLEIPKIGDFFP